MITPAVLRSFAGGLIVAAGIIGIVYLSGGSGEGTTVKKMSEKEMKTELAEKGYMIHTEEEWNQQVAAIDRADAKADKPAKNETEAPTEPTAPVEEETAVYKTIVNVSSGMTSIDVGRTLETAKIIPSAFEFSQEVERRGLSNKLKPGVFEIESNMNIDQILAVIFP
jgi:hypothetical protein